MSYVTQNLFLGFPTRSNTNQAVQLQEMARGLEENRVIVLFNLCSKNKGGDQLRCDQQSGYCAADLSLCFCIFS